MKQCIQQIINSNLLALSWIEILNDLDVACFEKGPGKSPRFPLAALIVEGGWAVQKGLSKYTRRIAHRELPPLLHTNARNFHCPQRSGEMVCCFSGQHSQIFQWRGFLVLETALTFLIHNGVKIILTQVNFFLSIIRKSIK